MDYSSDVLEHIHVHSSFCDVYIAYAYLLTVDGEITMQVRMIDGDTLRRECGVSSDAVMSYKCRTVCRSYHTQRHTRFVLIGDMSPALVVVLWCPALSCRRRRRL